MITPIIEQITDINTLELPTYYGRTYKVNIKDNNIGGYTDDIDALTQTIYLILNTERYKYLIYSWDYGVELVDLIGQPMPYVKSEVQRRIRDALITDDRIDEVDNFVFDNDGRILYTAFLVHSNIADFVIGTEVEM